MNQANAGNVRAGLTNDQLQQLNQRFRCKADLYTYLDKYLQIYLPKEKNCSVQVSPLKILIFVTILVIFSFCKTFFALGSDTFERVISVT